MKDYNLQRDILKKIINILLKDKDEFLAYEYDEEEHKYYITDGYKIFIIDENNMFLNLGRLKKMDVKNIFKNEDKVEVRKSTTIEEIGKDKVRLFKSNTFNLWINDKFLKYFDDDLMVYKGNGSSEALFCYETANDGSEKLVAILMPIKRNDER